MDVDIIISPTASRTYSVPAAVVAAVASEWTHNEIDSEHPDYDLAVKLAVSRKVTLDDVLQIHTASGLCASSGSGQSDPVEASRFAFRGGVAGAEWAEKIIASISRADQLDRERRLGRLDYDPEHFAYFGLTADNDEDMITTLARMPIGETSLDNAERFTSTSKWETVYPDGIVPENVYGVHLEPDILAFTASAFMEGAKAVRLAYGEPVFFLPEPPLLASGSLNVPKGGFVYAIVDAADTTAVMDVIMIVPGPKVFRRNGKAWVLDEPTLDSLLSATPPPIVELSGDTLTNVMEQLDSSQVNQVAPDHSGSAAVGEALETTPIKPQPGKKPTAPAEASTPALKPVKPEAPETEEEKGSKGGVTASIVNDYRKGLDAVAAARQIRRDSAIVRHNSDDGHLYPLTAALEQIELDTATREYNVRVDAMVAAVTTAKVLRERQRVLENIILPVTTALVADAQSVHSVTPNQRKAESLRKYWMRGVGAVKIRWGAKGDFTRCVRQLRPYLGARTEGYCAKRHKESVGFWPGDKRNQ